MLKALYTLINFFFKDRKIARIWGVDVMLYGAVPPLLFILVMKIFTAMIPETAKDGDFIGFLVTFIVSISVIAVYAFLFFAALTAHELAHIRVGAKYGIKAKKIFLTPLGGLAFISNSKEATNPQAELNMALAGPACSAALAGITAVLSLVPFLNSNLLSFFCTLNLALAVFNLIPAYPMDGGRILRAILATRSDPYQSTVTVLRIGIFLFLCVFSPIGILTDYKSLLFIGLFFGIVCTLDLITIKRALRDHFIIDTRKWEDILKESYSADQIKLVLSELESFPKIPFLVICEALSELTHNEVRYDYRSCRECTSEDPLCYRYADSMKMLKEKETLELDKKVYSSCTPDE